MGELGSGKGQGPAGPGGAGPASAGPGEGRARPIRVFLSSPSDVFAEREAAEAVVKAIEAAAEGRVRFEVIRWEKQHYTAAKGFQDQIASPAECDLVVCIFWSRLGLELTESFARADGSPRTGSEYEFETALERARRDQVPDILVYRRQALLSGLAPEELEARNSQYRALEGFFGRWFRSEEGHYVAAYKHYAAPEDFATAFRRDLSDWLDKRLKASAWDATVQGSPFRGLRVYESEHADIFFGRHRAERQALARLFAGITRGGAAFLLVLGASGSGKSSLLRAGLLPRLLVPGGLPDVEAARVVTVKPGSVAGDVFGRLARLLMESLPELREGDFGTPDALAAALAGPPETAMRVLEGAQRRWAEALMRREARHSLPKVALILFIDQMEEAFTILADSERETPFALVRRMASTPGFVVLATLRGDYYGQIQTSPSLLRLKEEGVSYDLAPPSQGDVAEIIAGPARLAGLSYERDPATGRDLAEDLAKEADAPGALPLLSFTLGRLYDLRDPPSGLMRLADYDRLGGLKGAIGDAAERSYAALEGAGIDEVHLRRVLRRLVREGEGRLAARPADLADFRPGSPERQLIEAFVSSRLFQLEAEEEGGRSTTGARVRVAHEALLGSWPRAARLIAEDRIDLARLQPVEEAEQRWRRQGGPADLLIPTGLPLKEAEALDAAFDDDLAPGIRAFIAASRAAEAARQAMDDQRRARELRFQRLTRRLAVAASVLFVAALAVAVVAAWQWTRADTQSRNADAAHQEAIRQQEVAAQRGQEASVAQDAADAAQQRAIAAGTEAEQMRQEAERQQQAATAFAAEAAASASAADAARQQAEAQRTEALAQRDQALRTRSLFLADLARQRAVQSDFGTAIALGVEALADPDTSGAVRRVPEAERVLYTALWNLKEAHVLAGHSDRVRVVRFSPDGKRLLTGSNDGSARLWDVASGKLIAVLVGHADAVMAGAFSSDGSLIATGSSDGGLRVWRGDSGTLVRALRPHGDMITGLSFSSDGTHILSASWDRTARIDDALGDGRSITLSGHDNHVWSAAYAPDEKTVVTAADDGLVRIFSAADGTLLRQLATGQGALFAAFSPDGAEILATDRGGSAIVFDVLSGERRAEIDGVDVACMSCAAFSPDGKVVAIGGSGAVSFFDARSGSALARTRGPDSAAQAVRFSPDGKNLLSGWTDGSARLDRVDDGSSLAVFTGHDGAVQAVDLAPDGETFATAGDDGTARIWKRQPVAGPVIVPPGQGITWAAYSPDGTTLAIGGRGRGEFGLEGKLELLRTDTGERYAVLSGHHDDIAMGAFSPDGSRLVTVSQGTGVYQSDGRQVLEPPIMVLWNVPGRRKVALLSGHADHITSVAFSPDGALMLSASNDGTARLWNAETGAALATLAGHTGVVNLALFSPDGSRIVTASQDRTARLWDRSGALIAVLAGHTESVVAAAFSPDGTKVATGSADFTARLWDAGDGTPGLALTGHGGWVGKVAFAGNDRLVTASSDGTVRLWNTGDARPMIASDRRSYNGGAAAVADDGALISMSWGDDDVRVVDPATGSIVADLGVLVAEQMQDFVPGSHLLVVRSNYGLQIWRLPEGDLVAELSLPFRFDQPLILAPTGRSLAVVNGDFELLPLWPAAIDLLEAARQLMPRQLTTAQRHQFFLE